MKIIIPPATTREVYKSDQQYIHLESAIDCEGCCCGCAVTDPETGELEPVPPHFHIVLSGKKPESGRRYYPVAGELPKPIS